MTALREAIQSALADFQSLPLPDAAQHLLNTLGYHSDRTAGGEDRDDVALRLLSHE